MNQKHRLNNLHPLIKLGPTEDEVLRTLDDYEKESKTVGEFINKHKDRITTPEMLVGYINRELQANPKESAAKVVKRILEEASDA